ncbi:uncharacterized protein LOC113495379 isoform X3 [Trichoplusia ni]|uniref:Uncharacterized protein LOC113495379 isoform X3 n=1 Tax=Trichoplusia ni TaxID=7111 RepID=A0A7E5VNG4_TRINI|nr:uncharacterized protein LOC113495379 isoform X3 [Trichoplusia ni]
MEGDKPILRMAEEPPEDPTTVSESTIKPAKARSSADSYEKMLKDMSLLIDWLVEDFGYDVVPEVHRRTGMSQDPTWMSDLKAFIKDLVSRFGQEDLDRYTKPVMAALEKKHNIRVTDIDGNIIVLIVSCITVMCRLSLIQYFSGRECGNVVKYSRNFAMESKYSSIYILFILDCLLPTSSPVLISVDAAKMFFSS